MKNILSLFLAVILFTSPVFAELGGETPVGGTGGTALPSYSGVINPQSVLLTGPATAVAQNYYFFNNDPALMLSLRGCFDAVVSGQASCNILHAGDSTTVGFGSAGTGDRKALSYPTQFANMLNAAGINASWQNWMGCGDGTSCSNDARITVGSGWSDTSGVITIGGNVLSATSSTSNFSFTPTVPVNSCTVYYVQNPSNGSFSWNYDGGSNTTISETGTDLFQNAVIAAPALGTHTLNFNWVSGTVQIIGTICTDSSKSWVNIINAGWSGSEATQWALNNSHPWGIVSGPANLGAAATVVDLGINSWNNGTSVATFKTAFATTLADMPGTVVIMTPAPSATSSASVATQQQYVTAMYQDAGTTIPLIDEYQKIGTYAAANALTPSWYYNTLHPSATGYADFAAAMYSLTGPLRTTGSVTTPYIYNNIAPNDITNSSIAIGAGAMAHTVAGFTYNDTAVGVGTLTNSGMTSAALNNSAFGNSALPAVTTGNSNTAGGASAGHAVSTGSNNTFWGYDAGFNVTTSGSNSGFGYDACFTSATNGSACSGFGALALAFSTGQHETGIGIGAGEFVGSGPENTAGGYASMQGITGTRITGTGNTAYGSNSGLLLQGAAANNALFGYLTGNTITSGTLNSLFGENAQVNAATDTNELVFGAGLTGGGSNTVNVGGILTATGIGTPSTAVPTIAGTVNMPNLASSSAATTGTVCWTTSTGRLTVDTTVACLASLEELKDIQPGGIPDALEIVKSLNPFWYTWKKGTPEYAGDTYEQPGLGAHATESVDNRLVGYDAEGKVKGVRYQQMVAVLVAAMKEQQKEIEALQTNIAPPYHKCLFGLLMCAD